MIGIIVAKLVRVILSDINVVASHRGLMSDISQSGRKFPPMRMLRGDCISMTPTSIYVLASVAALPPPGFETLSKVNLLQYQADHLDFCCVSTTVYLDLVLLCICSCVSTAMYPPLCIRHCVSATVSTVLYIHYCICCCSSTTVYPLLCICRRVSVTVYIVLCILNYFCISAAVNMYPDLVLYIWLYICHCIHICHGVSATVSAALCIRCCICPCVSAAVSATVYPLLFIRRCYPLLLIWYWYPPLCICRCIYIFHCISSTVYLQLCLLHRQKCKSTMGCATRTRTHAQHLANFP